jgi:hypothetical protein
VRRRAEDDATIVLHRPPAGAARAAPPRRGRAAGWIAAAVVVLLLAVGGGAWLWIERALPPAPTAPPAPTPARPDPSQRADVATILAHQAAALTVFRLADNPRILVLDFPSLAEQGRMLNRVAALIEKAGLPRDRVLTDAELAAAIAARGETAETFYFGHNYRATDLAKFFALAARDGVALNEAERQLAALLADTRAAPPGPDGLPRADPSVALISLSAAETPGRGLAARVAVDGSVRAVILRHELSHGEFFTNQAFADHVARWWHARLTEAERGLFRRFLAEGGYDPALDEVMMNEAMAYLMYTPDPRFFGPEALGVTPAALEDMRARFRDGLPPTWLARVWPRFRGNDRRGGRRGRPRQRSATSTISTWAAIRPARPSRRRSPRAAR